MNEYEAAPDLASDESRREIYGAATPAWGDADYNLHAALFNDVTRAPASRVLFSERKTIADYLWSQGWRREMRPDDYTERKP